jgi:hypothetical protein
MKGSSFRNATVFDTCSVVDLEGCVDIKENQTATSVSRLN